MLDRRREIHMEMQQDPSPEPGPGTATGQSSSSGGVNYSKLHLRAYAKVDANPPKWYGGDIKRQLHNLRNGRGNHIPPPSDVVEVPVLVSITAMSSAMTKHRPPVDLVVVLHVRPEINVVPENWRELLIAAMDVVVEKLDDHQDRVAVVTNRQSSSTLMQPRRPSQAYSQNNVPRSYSSLVEVLEAAESILHGRANEEKRDRAGHIVVISNSNEEEMDSLLLWRFRSVHAFGFRDAHNAITMRAVSSIRNCTYGVLDDEHGRITRVFFATINRITSAASAILPVTLKLKCEQNVVLSAIDTPGIRYSISPDKKAAIVWPSVHLPGVTTNFVAYLGGLQRNNNIDLPLQLFTIQAVYGGGGFSASSGDKQIDLKVQVVTTKGAHHGSKEVAAEVVRVQAFKIVSSIIARAVDFKQAQHDIDDCWHLHALAYDLRDQWAILDKSACGMEAAGVVSGGLAADMREMEVRLYNNYYWLEYMLTWLSHQQWQLPLPRLFMHSQSTFNTTTTTTTTTKEEPPIVPMQLLLDDGSSSSSIHGGKTSSCDEHRNGLPVEVAVRVVPREAGLAMVKRAFVDLVVVIDASYGLQQKEMKTQERRQLLNEANELQKQHNMAMNKVQELEKKLKKVKRVDKKIDELEIKLTMVREADKRGELLEMLRKLKEEDEQQKQLNNENTRARTEMNNIFSKINDLRDRAKQLDMDVTRVMENTEKRLDLLTKAIQLVTKKLSVKDRLAIVPVQSFEPATALMEMSKQGRTDASVKVQRLSMAMLDNEAVRVLREKRPSAYKKWTEQPEKALRLLRNCLQSAPSSSTTTAMSAERQGTTSMAMLSSDGGGTKKMLHNALNDAVKILGDRGGDKIHAEAGKAHLRKNGKWEEDENRPGFIIVISDSDDDSICLESLSSNYTIHAFGFYGRHNSKAMSHIAHSSNGINGTINDDRNKITKAFTTCINEMTSVIFIDTKVEIMLHSNLALCAIESGRFKSSIGNDGKPSSIFIGALSATEVLDKFTVYVDNVHNDDYGHFSKLFTICVKWLHPLDRVEENIEDEVVVGTNGIFKYKEVVKNIAYVEAVKITG